MPWSTPAVPQPGDVCSCSCREVHRVARRVTADGARLDFFSDGTVAWPFGFRLEGVGDAQLGWTQSADITAAKALLGIVEILDRAEVPVAFQALRRECRKPYSTSCTWRWGASGGPTAQYTRQVVFEALDANS